MTLLIGRVLHEWKEHVKKPFSMELKTHHSGLQVYFTVWSQTLQGTSLKTREIGGYEQVCIEQSRYSLSPKIQLSLGSSEETNSVMEW